MASGNAEAAAESERLANEAFERDQLAARQAAEIAEQSEAAARAEAETARMTAAVISAPVAYVAPAKAAGISVSKGVDYEMADLLELVKHIAAGNHDLISLVRHDDVKMRAYVKGLGMNTKLPGVRVFEKRTMAARS